MITQLDDRRSLEHSLRVDDQLAMLEGVDVTLDQQQIGAALDGQEALARNIDTVCVLEVFDRCSCGGLKLDDGMSIVVGLGVDDDLKIHAFVFHDALECFEINPEVIGVEDLELANWGI